MHRAAGAWKRMDGKRTCTFAAFLFWHLCILALGNRAGEGLLSTAGRERVYYVIQVFVLLGLFGYALLHRRASARTERAVLLSALGLMLPGGALLLFSGGTMAGVIVTFPTVLCLGVVTGGVYLRMSEAAAAGQPVAMTMGLSYAAAIGLQYLLQLRWGITPLLPVAMLAALCLLGWMLWHDKRPTVPVETAGRTEPKRLLFSCLIALILLIFAGFYNEYIHHLQISSHYGDYNVYSWPRLMMIPGYLLFAVLGDRRGGKYVPMVALSLALAALLNSVLTGNAGAYWLNMCLFYVALCGAVAYYNLTFWRLAQRTEHPALWAMIGRAMDSANVLLLALLGASAIPAAGVLTVDILGLIVIILLMALNGDLSFEKQAPEPPADPPVPEESEEEKLRRLSAVWALTPKESEVLEAVLHSDLPTGRLAETLGMGERTLYRHLSNIYRKTGADSRMSLVLKFHEER